MGWYLRKSASLGPVRLNFSRGGIGVSFGVRGARIGVGPKGKYVHVGRYGLYYRQYLHDHAAPAAQIEHAPPSEERIESADVSQMADEASAALLEEIGRARSRVPLLPVAIVGTIVVVLLLRAAGASALAQILCLVVGLGLAVWAGLFDGQRGAVELEYELSGAEAEAYRALVSAGAALTRVGRVRLIEAVSGNVDWKREAGASSLVRTRAVFPSVGAPRGIRSKTQAPILPCGRQELCFLPDRVLVLQGGRAGAVMYPELHASVSEGRFIESDGVPADAQVVDQTWQYVNRSGGPDRRFSNNRQLPIARYAELSLASASGLNERLQISSVAAAHAMAEAITGMARAHNANVPTQPVAQAASATARLADVLNSPRVQSIAGQATRDSMEQLDSAEITRIQTERPRGWEYLLFDAALRQAIAAHRGKAGTSNSSGPPILTDYDDQQVFSRLAAFPDVAIAALTAIGQAIDSELPVALGAPGQAGDASAITRVAEKIGTQYGQLRVSLVRLATEFVTLKTAPLARELATCFAGLCEQIEGFSGRIGPGLTSALQTGASVDLSLQLSMPNQDALMRAMTQVRTSVFGA